MSTKLSDVTSKYYNSAIGTHRLRPRPLRNILYPYYRNYKPVYRARNQRTPLYFWPEIDKYPWHSHQKRFPRLESIGINFFSEFIARNESIKTLFEVLHPLPRHGVNCIVWKVDRGNKERMESKVINIDGTGYLVDYPIYKDVYYHVKDVNYKLRPFKAKVSADLYSNGKLIKSNVSPIGSIRGIWRFSYPYILSEGNIDENRTTINPYLYRNIDLPEFKDDELDG